MQVWTKKRRIGRAKARRDGLVHQEAAGSLADEAWDEAEEGQFHLTLRPKVEFQQADIRTSVVQGIGLDLGIAEDLGETRRRASRPG